MLAAVTTPPEEFEALYALGEGAAEETVQSTPTRPDTAAATDSRQAESASYRQPKIDWSNVAFALTFSLEARRRAAKG
ncbi:MAG: hypothetical protein AAF367_11300 [Pseudomonadota bacterium]